MAEESTPDVSADAIEAYEYAQQRALDARKEWEQLGKPYTVELANGVQTIDPMWKVMIEAETMASRLREKLAPKRAAGRPKGATSAPDRGDGRPAPLRRVK